MDLLRGYNLFKGKIGKRLLAILLVQLLLIGSWGGFGLSQAYGGEAKTPEARAQALNSLGLFQGVGPGDYALEKPATRMEALVMLIRLLGQEDEALMASAANPFTDVPGWATKYAAYAYDRGLTKGVSDTKFGASDLATPGQYLTFVLRALGYSDVDGDTPADFSWSNPQDLAGKLGISVPSSGSSKFLRGDMAWISYDALSATMKNTEDATSEGSITPTETKLADSLIAEGVFTKEKFTEAQQHQGTVSIPKDPFVWASSLNVPVSDKPDAIKKLSAACEKVPGTITLLVPKGEEKEYSQYIFDHIDMLFDKADSIEAEYIPRSGKLVLTVYYPDNLRVLTYLKNPTIPASQQTKEWAAKFEKIFFEIIKPGMDDSAKIKAVHDYIAGNARYGDPSAEIMDGVKEFFEDGRIVCGGYSKVFQVFMGLCGIESMVVTGPAGEDGSFEDHAWNKVRVGNRWHNVDVTWDDPVVSDGSHIIRYDYFMVNDSFLSKTHSWDRSFYPEAV